MTPAEDALLERARQFARERVAPDAAQWERARTLGRDALTEAAEIGLTRLQVPVEQGGLGFSFSCKAKLGDILAGADFGFAMSLLNTQNIAHRLARDVAPEVAARYLPDVMAARRLGCTALTESHAGSDFGAITTTATRDGDGWVLSGSKAWIINAVAADVVVLYAQTQPGKGGAGIASFLIDGQRPGFARHDRYEMSGQHSIGAGGFTLTDYRAEASEMVRPAGEAFKSALTDINGARIYVGAMCCGMVAAAIEIAAAYGRSRTTFGKPLADNQGWRWRLAEAEIDLSAARQMVQAASALIDADANAMVEAARTKVFATRMAERHLPALAQLMGAEGLREHYPFGRHLLGARVASFTDGSTEMLLERLAGAYRKGPPDTKN